MAKTKISEFSTTAGNNTDINSINIAEGCAPSGINDAIRELMRQLKEFQTGGAGDSVNSGGDFSVATNKFTVASASGNTAVAGTLAVTGTTTLTGALVANGNATLGDGSGDTVTVKGTPTLEVNPTLSGGTANGVLYLNGSKVASSGSALTFDGTNLGVSQSSPSTFNGKLTVGNGGTSEGITIYAGATGVSNGALYFAKGTTGTQTYAGYVAYFGADDSMRFAVAASEAMRLTSTGLGIGTSSPGMKLDVVTASGPYTARFRNSSTSTSEYNVTLWTQGATGSATGYAGTGGSAVGGAFANTFVVGTQSAHSLVLATNDTARATLDSSGNLGLGLAPSAWGSNYRAIQLPSGIYGGGSFLTDNGSPAIAANAYNNSGWKYVGSDYATIYQSRSGQHQWFTAASGTAGNAITFTQAMTLDASGNLLVGGTSTSALDGVFGIVVGGSAKSTGGVAIESSTSQWLTYTDSNQAMIFYDARLNTERARIDSGGNFIHQVNGTAPSLSTNSTMSFELTSNTSLKIVVRGTDGTTRSATLVLV